MTSSSGYATAPGWGPGAQEMVGPREMFTKVECYAGYKGEQTPRAIVLGDRRITVDDVLDQWLAPDHRYFKIRGGDGDVYIVRQDVASGEWTLTMFRRGSG